jgi:membrane protein
MAWPNTWDGADGVSVWTFAGYRHTAKKLARRVWKELNDDNVPGLAAQASYYFVLALFPFLISLAALVGCLPFTGLWPKILNWVTLNLPWEAQHLVLQTVVGLTRGHASYLSLGLAGTAWAACGGFMNLMGSLNSAYEVRETRSYLRRVCLAFGMLLVLNCLVLGSFALLTAGDWLGDRVLEGAGPVATILWHVGRWLLSLALLALAISILDYYLPDLRKPWRYSTPGTLFVVLAWIPAMLGFNAYLVHFATYGKTYGALGTFVILMVWTYVASLIVLTGAEINSELYKMQRNLKSRAVRARQGRSHSMARNIENREWRPPGPGC